MVKIILLGPPGTGKGTQANLLAKKFKSKPISIGQLLRDNIKRKTKLGKISESYVSRGLNVPDKYVIDMVKKTLKKRKSFILDDFPRTLGQAIFFDKNFNANYIILIDSTKKAILARLKRRRKIEGREDDKERTIRKRLAIYDKITKKVINYYDKRKALIKVDGSPTNNDKKNIVLTYNEIIKKINRKF